MARERLHRARQKTQPLVLVPLHQIHLPYLASPVVLVLAAKQIPSQHCLDLVVWAPWVLVQGQEQGQEPALLHPQTRPLQALANNNNNHPLPTLSPP